MKTNEKPIDINVPMGTFYNLHDVEIANFLRYFDPTLEIDEVPYASFIRFELWKKGHLFHVRSIYNGKELKVPHCDGVCPIH